MEDQFHNNINAKVITMSYFSLKKKDKENTDAI